MKKIIIILLIFGGPFIYMAIDILKDEPWHVLTEDYSGKKKSKLLIDNNLGYHIEIEFSTTNFKKKYIIDSKEHKWIKMYADEVQIRIFNYNSLLIDNHTINLKPNTMYIYNPLDRKSYQKGVYTYGYAYSSREVVHGKLIEIEKYDYILKEPPSYSRSGSSHSYIY